MRLALRWLSNGLIGLGVVILVGTGAVYGYSQYEQAQAAREVADLPPVATPVWTPAPVSTVSAAPTRASAVGVADGAEGPGRETFVPYSQRGDPAATSTPVPSPAPLLPADRIEAPAIQLDAKVVESPIVDGQWAIPKFAAGHLQGTAEPLQGGNVALAGHVESISSGNVFENLDRLHAGDLIRLYTRATVVSYRVDKVETVSNDDMKPLAPTTHEVLTLITCSGSWLPLQHDYSQRTVVVASRVS
ncbi:MAG TPA: sortase [Chloroflexota bacterium]|nr:sortase [Chloroflexota bacterium]